MRGVHAIETLWKHLLPVERKHLLERLDAGCHDAAESRCVLRALAAAQERGADPAVEHEVTAYVRAAWAASESPTDADGEVPGALRECVPRDGSPDMLALAVARGTGLLLRSLGAVAVSLYVNVGGAPDALINRRLRSALAAPSDGTWLELALRCIRSTARHEGHSAATRLTEALDARCAGGRRVRGLLQDLVAFRNRWIHDHTCDSGLVRDAAAKWWMVLDELDHGLADLRIRIGPDQIWALWPGSHTRIDVALNDGDEVRLETVDTGDPLVSLTPLARTQCGGIAFLDGVFPESARYVEPWGGGRTHVPRQNDRALTALDAALTAVPSGTHLAFDFSEYRSEQARRLVGRTEELEILADFVATGSGYSVVRGEPGSGKSALLAALADRAESAGVALGLHFCGYGQGRSSPTLAYRSMTLQLSRATSVAPGPYLTYDIRELSSSFTRFLHACVATRRCVLVVDGLDEGLGDPAGSVASYLPAELPDGVVCVVSFRTGTGGDPPAVACALSHLSGPPVPLPGPSPLRGLSSHEVEAWIVDRFGVAAREGDIEWISTRGALDAGGVSPLYLWLAEPVLAQRATGADVPLPSDVTGAIAMMWAELHDRADHRAAKLLTTLCVALGPLPVEAIPEVLQRFDPGLSASAVEETLDELAKLTRRVAGGVEPFHTLVSEWLLDTSVSGVSPKTIAAVHEALGSTVDADGEGPNSVQEYGLRYGIRHLIAAGSVAAAAQRAISFASQIRRMQLFGADIADGMQRELDDLTNTGIADARPDLAHPLAHWDAFIRRSSSSLHRAHDGWPAERVFLQRALEHADDSTVTRAAEAWVAEGNADWPVIWMRDRPRHARTELLVRTYSANGSPICGFLRWSAERFVTYDEDGVLRLWAIDRSRPVRSVRGSESPIRGLVRVGDEHAWWWHDDGTTVAWNIQDWTGHRLCEKTTVGVAPCTSGAAIAGSDGTVLVFDRPGRRALVRCKQHEGEPTALIANGDLICSYAKGEPLSLLWRDGTPDSRWRTATFDLDHRSDVGLYSSRFGALATQTRSVHVLRLTPSGPSIQRIRPETRWSHPPRPCACAPDRLALTDGALLQYADLETSTCQEIAEAWCGVRRPDGSHVVVKPTDPSMTQVAADGAETRFGNVHLDPIHRFVPLGPTAAATSCYHMDHTVRIWNLDARRLAATLVGHSGRVVAIEQWIVDGRPHVATGARDGTIRLWRMPDILGSGVSLRSQFEARSWRSIAIHSFAARPHDEAGGFEVWDARDGRVSHKYDDVDLDARHCLSGPVYNAVCERSTGRILSFLSGYRPCGLWDVQPSAESARSGRSRTLAMLRIGGPYLAPLPPHVCVSGSVLVVSDLWGALVWSWHDGRLLAVHPPQWTRCVVAVDGDRRRIWFSKTDLHGQSGGATDEVLCRVWEPGPVLTPGNAAKLRSAERRYAVATAELALIHCAGLLASALLSLLRPLVGDCSVDAGARVARDRPTSTSDRPAGAATQGAPPASPRERFHSALVALMQLRLKLGFDRWRETTDPAPPDPSGHHRRSTWTRQLPRELDVAGEKATAHPGRVSFNTTNLAGEWFADGRWAPLALGPEGRAVVANEDLLHVGFIESYPSGSECGAPSGATWTLESFGIDDSAMPQWCLSVIESVAIIGEFDERNSFRREVWRLIDRGQPQFVASLWRAGGAPGADRVVDRLWGMALLAVLRPAELIGHIARLEEGAARAATEALFDASLRAAQHGFPVLGDWWDWLDHARTHGEREVVAVFIDRMTTDGAARRDPEDEALLRDMLEAQVAADGPLLDRLESGVRLMRLLAEAGRSTEALSCLERLRALAPTLPLEIEQRLARLERRIHAGVYSGRSSGSG